MRSGFNNIEDSLKSYLEISNHSIKHFLLTIFGSITIENGTIIRATDKYHNKPWFSDVAIAMDSKEIFDYKTDEGLCYGQVIIIIFKNNNIYELIDVYIGFINNENLRRSSKKSIEFSINTMV
jgi:hypothetical protein